MGSQWEMTMRYVTTPGPVDQAPQAPLCSQLIYSNHSCFHMFSTCSPHGSPSTLSRCPLGSHPLLISAGPRVSPLTQPRGRRHAVMRGWHTVSQLQRIGHLVSSEWENCWNCNQGPRRWWINRTTQLSLCAHWPLSSSFRTLQINSV